MPPIPLNYANAPSRRRIKILILINLLIILTYFTWQYTPHTYQFARQYYWQYKCLNFDPPPGTVVYERLPNGSPKPAIVSPYMDGNFPQISALARSSGGLMFPLSPSFPVQVFRVPMCWTNFMQATQNKNADPFVPAVLFCHERTSPAGHRRLVTVQISARTLLCDCFQVADDMEAQVYSPIGWNGCRFVYQRQNGGINLGSFASTIPPPPPPPPSRFFAGQPDPADPTHFTIEYQWPDGVHGFVDGYLLDNDAVNLTDRPGPGDVKSAIISKANHPELWPPN